MIWKILGVVVGCILLVVIAGTGWIFSTVNHSGSASNAVTVTVAKGEGIRTVAQKLFDQHLIPNRQAWLLFAGFTGRFRTVMPGAYTIAPGTSGRHILDLLANGPTDSREVRVLIPEGKRLTDIAKLLETNHVVGAQEFLNLANHPATFVAAWPTELFQSKPATVDLEGYLFPDTYNFYKASTPAEVLQRIVANTDRRLTPDIRTQIAASGHTLNEIMTMASIIQMEVRSASDQAMAADLFWRRIAAGQPLESDATVSYATSIDLTQTSSYNANIASPFNTHLNKGLPPGPICNPGLGAILAAIHPTANEYWYFLTTPTGTTVWAKTYAEHLANKQKYLK